MRADDKQREVQERGSPRDRRQQRPQEHLQLLFAGLELHHQPRAALLQPLQPATLPASAILRLHHGVHEGAAWRWQVRGYFQALPLKISITSLSNRFSQQN